MTVTGEYKVSGPYDSLPASCASWSAFAIAAIFFGDCINLCIVIGCLFSFIGLTNLNLGGLIWAARAHRWLVLRILRYCFQYYGGKKMSEICFVAVVLLPLIPLRTRRDSFLNGVCFGIPLWTSGEQLGAKPFGLSSPAGSSGCCWTDCSRCRRFNALFGLL